MTETTNETTRPESKSLTDIEAESKQLLSAIRQALTALEASLDLTQARDLQEASSRLLGTLSLRDELVASRDKLTIEIKRWKEDSSRDIHDYQELIKALTSIESNLKAGDFSSDDVTSLLQVCGRVINLEKERTLNHKKLEESIEHKDYSSAKSFLEKSELLDSEIREIYSTIDTIQSHPVNEKHPISLSEPAKVKEAENNAAKHPSKTPQDPMQHKPSGSNGNDSLDLNPAPSTENKQKVAPAPRILQSLPEELVDPGPTDYCHPPNIELLPKLPEESNLDSGVKSALDKHRLGLAYHLARSNKNASSLLGPDAVNFIALNYLRDQFNPANNQLSSLAAKLHHDALTKLSEVRDRTFRRSYVTLMVCASLKPALIAPGGPVAQLIKALEPSLHADLPKLKKLAKTAAYVSKRNVSLPFELLIRRESSTQWKAHERTLQKELVDWLEAEKQSTIRYYAATRVWRNLLTDWEKDGRASLGHLFGYFLNVNDEPDLQRIDKILEYWQDNSVKEKEIDRIDQSMRPLASSKKLHGSARQRLKQKIDEAITLVHRYRRTIDARPGKTTGIQFRLAEQLREVVMETAPFLLDEIQQGTPIFKSCIVELLRNYTGIFSRLSDSSELTSTIEVSDLLHGDLYASPDTAFDADGKPTKIPPPDELLRLAKADRLDFESVAIKRADQGDFENALATIDFAERSANLETNVADEVRSNVERIRENFKRTLEDEIRERSNELDVTYALGVLDARKADELRDLLPTTDATTFLQIDNFLPIRENLKKVGNEVRKAKTILSKNMNKRLDELDGLSSDDRKRIESLVKTNRFLIADEFLEALERNEPLPNSEASTKSPFETFFLDFLQPYCKFRLDLPDALPRITSTLEGRDVAGPIDATALSVDRVKTGKRLLDAWRELNLGKATDSVLRELMDALGFVRPKVRQETSPSVLGEKTFDLRTVPTADRNVVQIPAFGSKARGWYRLIVLRSRANAEAIRQAVGSWTGDGRPPSIILLLNVLNADERKSIALSFQTGDYHPAVVLDEALAVYIATQPNEYLATFFSCALPFSFADPYDPDAPEVPVEMFFGRKFERNAIQAMSGTHLVYGGRRLGKTVLLADIAREYQSDRKTLVELINLKGSGIGKNRRTDHLWKLFSEKLSKHGVVQATAVRYKTIAKSVNLWLNQLEGRRILLLVDEADDFLEFERGLHDQRYQVLDEVKLLMEETGRRFKVVFAGLHNVQRTARDSNTPLAHLGDPIKIGPMLPGPNGKRSEIENLIRLPLEALGYRFSTQDSIIRIAAETNYYPALAQQFCKELLRDLRGNSESHLDGPPYMISPEAVDRIFGAKETRDRIRNLFSWTIELDPRYEFLTYLIASHSFGNTDDDIQLRGISIDEVRTEALSLWPRGFSSDGSYLTFEVLLEEMVGLGILREDEGQERAFAIRSRNLRRLLGHRDEIETRLLDTMSKGSLPRFDAIEFRDTLSKSTNSPGSIGKGLIKKDSLLSALTVAQENMLLAEGKYVALVFGTILSGLERLHDSILRMVDRTGPSGELHLSLYKVSPSAMMAKIRQMKARTPKGGGMHLEIVLVDARESWCIKEVEQAVLFVSGDRAKNRIIRPVFWCDAEFAWTWINGGRLSRKGSAKFKEIWLGPCARNFTRMWLREGAERTYTDLETIDSAVDSLWPIVVERAATFGDSDSTEAVVDSLSEKGLLPVQDVIDLPHAKDMIRILLEFETEAISLDVLQSLIRDVNGETVSVKEISRLVDWAHNLGILRKDGEDYRLDRAWASGLGAGIGRT